MVLGTARRGWVGRRERGQVELKRRMLGCLAVRRTACAAAARHQRVGKPHRAHFDELRARCTEGHADKEHNEKQAPNPGH